MKTLKILYVEDEPDIRSIAVMALEAAGGFEVRECASGQEALREAETFSPDLLLLDVMMPGMNGMEVLYKLRSMPGASAAPAIFMTAKVQTDEVEQYISLGALGVIAKPFDPMTLPRQIRDIWNSSQEPGSD